MFYKTLQSLVGDFKSMNNNVNNKKNGEKFKINRELLNKDKNMKIRDVFIQGENCYYLE